MTNPNQAPRPTNPLKSWVQNTLQSEGFQRAADYAAEQHGRYDGSLFGTASDYGFTQAANVHPQPQPHDPDVAANLAVADKVALQARDEQAARALSLLAESPRDVAVNDQLDAKLRNRGL